MHFPIFLKLNVRSIIFSKFLLEIEFAAICFVMQRGRRKSQQNSRLRARAQIKLVYPNQGMIGKSKEFEDVDRVTSSFATYLVSDLSYSDPWSGRPLILPVLSCEEIFG